MKQISYTLLIIILTALAVVFFMRKCGNRPEIQDSSTEPIKAKVATYKQDQKKLKDSIVYRDIVRTKYLVMWKEVRHDSITPCETKLLVCDTVIRADSTLIVAQRKVIKTDSLIILSQDSIIRIDSIALRSNKKFWKGFKWGFGVGNVTGAAIGTSLRR